MYIRVMFTGEKQAATHVWLDQEYDREQSQLWAELEEQVVAVVNRGSVPISFQPTQYCLSSHTDNLRYPLAVVEGRTPLMPAATRVVSVFVSPHIVHIKSVHTPVKMPGFSSVKKMRPQKSFQNFSHLLM